MQEKADRGKARSIEHNIDVDAIIKLDQLNMEEFFVSSAVKFDPQIRREGLQKEIEKGAVFIFIRRGDELAAYLEYVVEADRSAYVASIQVHPKYRGTSILRRMFSEVYRELRKNYPTSVRTSVHKGNQRSLDLHKKLGFRETGRDGERVCFQIGGEELLKTIAFLARR